MNFCFKLNSKDNIIMCKILLVFQKSTGLTMSGKEMLLNSLIFTLEFNIPFYKAIVQSQPSYWLTEYFKGI